MKNCESEQPVFAKEMCGRDGSPAAQTLSQSRPFHGISGLSPVADMHVAISAVLSETQAQVLRAARLVLAVLCPKAGQGELYLSTEGLQFQICSVTATSHVHFSMLTCHNFSKKIHPVIPSEKSMQA